MGIGTLILIVWAPLIACDVAFHVSYARRLKKLYPDLAAKFHPRSFRADGFAAAFSSDLFIMRGQYRTLDNAAFVKFCDRYRLVKHVVLIIVLATVIPLGVYMIRGFESGQ